MEREREKEKEEDRATKSCYPGRQGATKALIWVTFSLHVFHYPERGLTETPTTRSCSPLRRNKAAGVKQRTSHLHTFRT